MNEVRNGKFDYWFLKSRPPGASLDGFLYPGAPLTVTKHDSAHRVVGLMLAEFNQAFSQAMHSAAAQQHRSVFQIVTMASIVQRESVRAKDLPYIASVYWESVDQRGRSCSDAGCRSDRAVCYGLPSGRALVVEQLPSKIDTGIVSPYNTYTHAGLPPGPISNPDLASLKAVIYPAHSDFLYFSGAAGIQAGKRIIPTSARRLCARRVGRACELTDLRSNSL